MSCEEEKEKSGSIYYVKFSDKSADFNEWKVTILSLDRMKKFDFYLKRDLSNSSYSDLKKGYGKGNADA